jgi:hypothetical protein
MRIYCPTSASGMNRGRRSDLGRSLLTVISTWYSYRVSRRMNRADDLGIVDLALVILNVQQLPGIIRVRRPDTRQVFQSAVDSHGAADTMHSLNLKALLHNLSPLGNVDNAAVHAHTARKEESARLLRRQIDDDFARIGQHPADLEARNREQARAGVKVVG